MEWELLGTAGLEEPEQDSTVMPRTSTDTLLSIFSSPISYTALRASQLGEDAVAVSLTAAGEDLFLFYLSMTFPPHLDFTLWLP